MLAKLGRRQVRRHLPLPRKLGNFEVQPAIALPGFEEPVEIAERSRATTGEQ